MKQSDIVADFEAHLAKQKRFPRVGEVTFSRYPHIVVTEEQYVFTSVHLTLRKTANYEVAQNAWAKPSAQLTAEIDQMEASLQLGARPPKSIIDRGVKTPLRRMRKRVKRAFGR